jgi:hypothetical protein
MGLFNNEAVPKDSPFRTGASKIETDVMEIVFEGVHWYKPARTRRRCQKTGGMIPGTVWLDAPGSEKEWVTRHGQRRWTVTSC